MPFSYTRAASAVEAVDAASRAGESRSRGWHRTPELDAIGVSVRERWLTSAVSYSRIDPLGTAVCTSGRSRSSTRPLHMSSCRSLTQCSPSDPIGVGAAAKPCDDRRKPATEHPLSLFPVRRARRLATSASQALAAPPAMGSPTTTRSSAGPMTAWPCNPQIRLGSRGLGQHHRHGMTRTGAGDSRYGLAHAAGRRSHRPPRSCERGDHRRIEIGRRARASAYVKVRERESYEYALVSAAVGARPRRRSDHSRAHRGGIGSDEAVASRAGRTIARGTELGSPEMGEP